MSDQYESTLPLNNQGKLRDYLEKKMSNSDKVNFKLYRIDEVIKSM